MFMSTLVISGFDGWVRSYNDIHVIMGKNKYYGLWRGQWDEAYDVIVPPIFDDIQIHHSGKWIRFKYQGKYAIESLENIYNIGKKLFQMDESLYLIH